jgi:hypothetical protein
VELNRFTASPADVAAFYAGQPKSRSKPKRGPTGAVVKVDHSLPKHREGERFIKGPIPLDWIKVASRCGYCAEAVGLLLWYASGLQRSNPCKLTPSILAELHVHPRTARRVLERFQEGGLVSVVFHRGRSPLVTLKTAPPSDSERAG